MKNEWSDLAEYKEQLRQELEAKYQAKVDTLEAEYEKNLEEGYEEAYKMVCELRNKTAELEVANTELRARITMIEGMGPEYEANVKQEREELGDYEKKLATLEVDMYTDYDNKVKEIREFIVNQVDKFLEVEWNKLCQAGEEELAAKLTAWRKALTPGEMVSLAVYGGAEPAETNEYLRTERRKVEAQVMRLHVENAKLTECIQHQAVMIAEAVEENKKLFAVTSDVD